MKRWRYFFVIYLFLIFAFNLRGVYLPHFFNTYVFASLCYTYIWNAKVIWIEQDNKSWFFFKFQSPKFSNLFTFLGNPRQKTLHFFLFNYFYPDWFTFTSSVSSDLEDLKMWPSLGHETCISISNKFVLHQIIVG